MSANAAQGLACRKCSVNISFYRHWHHHHHHDNYGRFPSRYGNLVSLNLKLGCLPPQSLFGTVSGWRLPERWPLTLHCEACMMGWFDHTEEYDPEGLSPGCDFNFSKVQDCLLTHPHHSPLTLWPCEPSCLAGEFLVKRIDHFCASGATQIVIM